MTMTTKLMPTKDMPNPDRICADTRHNDWHYETC